MLECSGIYNTNNIIFLGEAYRPRQMLFIFSGSSRVKSKHHCMLECSGIYNTNNTIFLGEAYKPRQMLFIFSGSSRLKS